MSNSNPVINKIQIKGQTYELPGTIAAWESINQFFYTGTGNSFFGNDGTKSIINITDSPVGGVLHLIIKGTTGSGVDLLQVGINYTSDGSFNLLYKIGEPKNTRIITYYDNTNKKIGIAIADVGLSSVQVLSYGPDSSKIQFYVSNNESSCFFHGDSKTKVQDNRISSTLVQFNPYSYIQVGTASPSKDLGPETKIYLQI